MISLRGIEKRYKTGQSFKYVAKDLNLDFPDKKCIGIFGKNGAGKSTLLRMIAGLERPDSGVILSKGKISWPIGFAGSCHPELTGEQNIRFVARIYGVETQGLIEFVRKFADLGEHFNEPFRTYSAGMRARLSFGISMGINFDTYLIDEVTAVGDAQFKKKSKDMLLTRIGNSSAIIVSHSMGLMREICDGGVILSNGKAKFFNDTTEAIEAHEAIMAGANPYWAESS